MNKRAIAAGAAAAVLGALSAGWLGVKIGQADDNLQGRIIPSAGSFSVSGQPGDRYAFFKGVWEIDGPEKNALLELVDYACFERSGECTEATATVYRNVMGVESRHLHDVRWSETKLTINESGSAMACREVVIVADFQTKDVTSITTDAPNRDPNCPVPPLEKPRKSRLIDGFARHFDERFPDRAKTKP
ncbi:hypothetical protein [Caulobacter sp. 17J80-11]|uniref:hypothetical protein n=1 Tax=Caulobacter sp. 17J80-11 TaxID=2763502 RepID=UPI001653C6B4|nr:hypothetical protein [Caulobacter sp. 17J80-11]MBC6982899.1 hypothetical protein [Caulobacter sp. 17J80-11]